MQKRVFYTFGTQMKARYVRGAEFLDPPGRKDKRVLHEYAAAPVCQEAPFWKADHHMVVSHSSKQFFALGCIKCEKLSPKTASGPCGSPKPGPQQALLQTQTRQTEQQASHADLC